MLSSVGGPQSGGASNHRAGAFMGEQLADEHVRLASIHDVYPFSRVEGSKAGRAFGTMPPEIVPSCNSS